jgi:hypothetical protein
MGQHPLNGKLKSKSKFINKIIILRRFICLSCGNRWLILPFHGGIFPAMKLTKNHNCCSAIESRTPAEDLGNADTRSPVTRLDDGRG